MAEILLIAMGVVVVLALVFALLLAWSARNDPDPL